jgi:hypothetical protein
MRTVIRLSLEIGSAAAIAFSIVAPVHAQYYYRPPPYASGPNNPCPMGYTVQGGICQPYQGPRGRWGSGPNNPCPMGYTLQGGECRPYQGPVGPGWGYYRRY